MGHQFGASGGNMCAFSGTSLTLLLSYPVGRLSMGLVVRLILIYFLSLWQLSFHQLGAIRLCRLSHYWLVSYYNNKGFYGWFRAVGGFIGGVYSVS
jgi:hypothetical protein